MKRLSLVLLLPITAQAEVMDKEPSLFSVLLTALVAILVSYWSACRWPWLLVIILPASTLLLSATALETVDPSVGPAIAAEAGAAYVATPWAGLVGVAIAAAVGLWRRRCAPNNSSKPTPLRGAA